MNELVRQLVVEVSSGVGDLFIVYCEHLFCLVPVS